MGNSSSSSRSSSEEEEAEIPVSPHSQPAETTTTSTQKISVENPYAKTHRMTAWICLLAANIVAMTSLLEFIGTNSGAAAFVFVGTIISIAIASISLVFYCFFKRRFYVNKLCGEGICSYLVFLVWMGALGVCMNPSRGLAETKTDAGLNVVKNANLYFSSWFAFISIFYICASWTMDHWKKAAEVVKAVAERLAKWWMLFIASVIVLVASAQFDYSQNCAEGGKTEIGMTACKSNRYAVALGAVASITTLVAIILSHVGIFPFLYAEVPLALLLIALYTAGVGVITYQDGSGVTIGNLYFATWAGFVISLFLNLDCYHEIMKRYAERKAAKASKKTGSKQSKKTQTKEPNNAAAAQRSAPIQSAQQSAPVQQRGISMRSSSIGDDEFADARDDLELKL